MSRRFFTESEIKKWNTLLEKSYSQFSLDVHEKTKSILVYEKKDSWRSSHLPSMPERKTLEYLKDSFRYTSFKYNFSFSVIKRRKDDFFKILDTFIESGIEIGRDDKEEAEKPLIDLRKEVYKFRETEHSIGSNDLIRIQYSFTNILSAMFVTTLIEDTIGFFEIMWGYTEDGEEKCLLKYPVGSIVSIKDKKGIDYMINGYEMIRPNSTISYDREKPLVSKLGGITKPTILYDLVCIESGINSGIVRYGSSCIANEDDICPSRTNNLNIILN